VLERIRTVSKEKILRYLGRVEEPVLSSLFGENVP
jgi:hypothetical protein